MSRVGHMPGIGNMQGRLSPPFDGRVQFFPKPDWKTEFVLASEIGFCCIEWVYDAASRGSNPIETEDGRAEMAQVSARTGVGVQSLCAHYFVERPLLRVRGHEAEELLLALRQLVAQCRLANISRLVLPLLEEGGIRTVADADRAEEFLTQAADFCAASKVELHLECDLEPSEYARLLEKLPFSVRVLYDTGNSTGSNYDVDEELSAYGWRIGSVHVKDRRIGGNSVPLGTGDADLELRLHALLAADYKGDFILEAARGESGRELDWAKRNLAIVRKIFQELDAVSAVRCT